MTGKAEAIRSVSEQFKVKLTEVVDGIMAHLRDDNAKELLGPGLSPLIGRGSLKSVVTFALYADVLRMVRDIVMADGDISDEEVQESLGLLSVLAAGFAKARKEYASFAHLKSETARQFLQLHSSDRGLFGHTNTITKWSGVKLCHSIKDKCLDHKPLESLSGALLDWAKAIAAADKTTASEMGAVAALRGVLAHADENRRTVEIDVDGDLDSEDVSYKQWRLAGGESAEWLRSRRERFGNWLRHSQQGDPRAQFFAGLCYDLGLGIDEDKDEAVRWYRAAADLGHAGAMFNLGGCYDRGNGIDEDKDEAVRWYRAAADLGHAGAMFNLGGCYDRGNGIDEDKDEAVRWYRAAADLGHAGAMFDLGICYDSGDGVDEDKVEAVRWYRAAADLGHAAAMSNLGVCYDSGDGVDEDKEEAVRWYQAAADLGYADAMFNLGVCYDRGNGIDEDKDEAVRWYRAAADRGNDEAVALLQRLRFEDARTALASRNETRCGLADVPAAECLDVSAILALADATDDEEISTELWTAIRTLTSEDGEPHAYAMAQSILSPFLESDNPAEKWIARFELAQHAAFDRTSDTASEEGVALLIRCLGCPYRDVVTRAVFVLYQLLHQENVSQREGEYATLLLACGHHEAFPKIAEFAAESGNEELSWLAFEQVRESYHRGTEPRIRAERQIATRVLASQPSVVQKWFEQNVDAIPDSAWAEDFAQYVFTGLHFNVEGGGAGVATTFFGDCGDNCFFQPVQEKCPCGRTPEALLHCLAGRGDGIYRVYEVQDEHDETVGAFTLFGDAADAEEHFAGERETQARTQDEEEGEGDAEEDAVDAESAAATGDPETLRDILAGAAPLRLGELDVDGTLLFSDASRTTADRDVTVDVEVPAGRYSVICWLSLPNIEGQSYLRPIALMAIGGGLKKAFDGYLPRLSTQSLRDLAMLTWKADGMVVASHLEDVRPRVLAANYEADTSRENTARAISWLLQLAEADTNPRVVEVLHNIDLSESDARNLLRARGIASPELSWLLSPGT